MNCYFVFGLLVLLCLQFNSLVDATGIEDVGPRNPAIDADFGFAGNEFGRNPNYRKKRQYGYGMYGMGGYPYGGYGGYGMGYGMGGAASMLGAGLMMLGR